MPDIMTLLEGGAAGEAEIRFEPSGVRTSTRALWDDGERVARHLAARVGRGTGVAAFLSNTEACPAAVFGVWRSGNTLVSLPYPGRGADLDAYVAQVQTMCRLADVALVLVDQAYAALIPPLDVQVATFQEVAAAGGPPCDTERSGDLVQFTSGSLGTPRGVRLTSQALGANVTAIIEALGIRAGDVSYSWLPMSHDMGFVGMFLTCVASTGRDHGGSAMVVQTPESFLADPASWLRGCARTGATVTTAPNFAFELACRAAPLLRGVDLSRIRVCITGAERVQAATLERFTDVFAPAGLRSTAMCPAYGMAEASLAVTMVRPDEHWRDLSLQREALHDGRIVPATSPDAAPVRQVSNGRPVAGTEVRVVAVETSAPLGEREIGEVHLRGASLLSGYVGADLVRTDDGWFPTRDLGFVDDGELFLVGRSDETIIVGGRNHYAPDIETALAHDAVRAGCLAAVPLDEGFALVAEPHGSADAARLQDVCRELVAMSVRHIGIRPSLVGFVAPGRLPKTPSGKLRRVPLAQAIRRGELELASSVTTGGTL